jgi:hypothetical protein
MLANGGDMKFIVKKLCENGVRVVAEFNTYEAALAKKAELLARQEFSECFIDIVAPQGFQIAG